MIAYSKVDFKTCGLAEGILESPLFLPLLVGADHCRSDAISWHYAHGGRGRFDTLKAFKCKLHSTTLWHETRPR